jgi:hypothetical protein
MGHHLLSGHLEDSIIVMWNMLQEHLVHRRPLLKRQPSHTLLRWATVSELA